MENTNQKQASDQDTKERQEAEAAVELLRVVEEAGSDEEVKEEVKEEEDQEEEEEVKDRVYCYCNGPGTGRMVACDGKHCEREWFHFRCIGLKTAPTTKRWYCDDCLMLG